MADFMREEVIEVVLNGRKRVGADLQDIDLSEANLNVVNLEPAMYDAGTKWPEGFDPMAAEAVLVDD
ncbi:MAG TPA: hypothetical protein QGI62_08920 [Anaerolineales bacterium]|jgi:uncharacterized protein YjbI with pentapeptide repeats|nr:hypothetical protein [Anaerolineales bacterium]|tara:strand:+ start:167 stop:367 length:201 start_codon:yes stop_codon:yes gene_type:complete